MPAESVKDQLLDAAQGFVQRQGYHGFSYRDLSATVGITTASIHYHFATKAELAVALVRRYREAVSGAFADVAVRSTDLGGRLDGVAGVFQTALSDGRVCLCGALAGEFQGLPEPVQREVQRYIESTEGWLARFFGEAMARGELSRTQSADALARLWFAGLQGGLLMARAADPTQLGDVVATLKSLTLDPPTAKAARR